MMERFPEIFAGKTNIEARSTVVIRCILSMENGLQAMLRKNPQLHIFHDASYHDMYYMNQPDKRLDSLKNCIGRKVVQEELTSKHDNYKRVMEELFNDPAWVKQNINQRDLNHKLYEMAGAIQGTELRGKVSLYDLFTQDELYDNWVVSNSWWQMSYGNSPYTGNVQPYSQRNLLRDIIEKADSCIALPHPGATLRYGHDTMVTPLTCLLNLNGYGAEIKDPEKIATQWFDYKITPMATNLQFVFYRKAKSDDILVKVLLNEDEATHRIMTISQGGTGMRLPFLSRVMSLHTIIGMTSRHIVRRNLLPLTIFNRLSSVRDTLGILSSRPTCRMRVRG